MNGQACIVNGGGGARAFAGLAEQLSDALWLPISPGPRQYNYLLVTDQLDASRGEFFIPLSGMELASDKRLLAQVFAASGAPTPETKLVPALAEAEQILRERPDCDWCLSV